ncbi:MAG TPA: glycosyltransferase family 39 protein [Acidobacteriaceae bacterium]|jgi:4-amino-4-deoxy-L-arabinose transferase-like glycosyltransferase|nr:glycosyltransferase family 39 protein [Acidobacteriaceae bacterium]
MRASGMKAAWIAGALVAGLGLRAAFLAQHPQFSGDALVYGELAHNMLAHHMYVQTDPALHATLIRMPGYPLFLALCFKLFGDANYLAVLWVQAGVDLATCGLIWTLARRVAGERAGWWALWLSALCPFTANYAAVALAETCSLFCVALAFFALERWIARRRMRWVVVIGFALVWALFLRPDEGLLAAAVVPVMAWVGWRRSGEPMRKRFGPAVVAALFVVLPVMLWGVRNWRVFHVVQPLAPRYANDPGEEVPYGFMRWYRTWAIGYPATVNVYWMYDGSTVDVHDLPARAFDDARQREETMAAFAEYNREQSSTPAVDAEFARLAEERVRAHPVEYYVLLPVARELDMWFRPRTALTRIPLDWWRVREHPWGSAEAMGLALLNAAYLLLAAVGVVRWRRARWNGQAALAWAMGAFVVLRCVLLLTIDNAEMRYTLECFPVVLVLCGVAAAEAKALETDGPKSAA